MSELLLNGTDNLLEYDMGAVIYGEGVVTNLDFHR